MNHFTCMIFVIFAIVFTQVVSLQIPIEDQYEDRLADDILYYLNTGNQTKFLQENIHNAIFPSEGRYKNIYELPRILQQLACTACRVAFGIVLTIVQIGSSNAEVYQKSISLCGLLGFGDDIVCRNAVAFNLGAVLHIVRNTEGLSSEFVCGNVFQGTCTHNDVSRDWLVQVEIGGSEIKGPKGDIPYDSEPLVVAHITDTHYDPEYKVGSNAVCGSPLCCRAEQGIPNRPEQGAGKWGDYRDCDMPWHAVQDIFTQIKENHKKIDYIYFTGDFIDHAVWATSFAGNTANIKKQMDALHAIFPNIPIYPAIGNHEPHPLNLFAPSHITDPALSTSQLYRFLADTWNFLPKDAQATIAYGGFYTVVPRKGLRIISLNNNLCNTYNFWNLYNTNFMREHLQWLHDTLLIAEEQKEKVHILGHMVSGESDCVSTWGREYRRIVDRFWNTISGQFIGHTHRDEFNIFYSRKNPNHAINVAWNGGSATPFSFVNSNYRLYSVERQTYQVIDHETWIYNLTEANLGNGSPRWFKEYSFKDAFGIENLSPASLNNLVNRFSRDDSLLYKYWEYYVKMGDPFLQEGCDRECLNEKLCRIVTTEFYDQSKCQQLKSLQHKIFDGKLEF